MINLVGNENSGNHGHAGRPGERGGSAPSGGAVAYPSSKAVEHWDHPPNTLTPLGDEVGGDAVVPTIGQPFIVYRLGSGLDESLDNRNAGNADGVAAHIAKTQDVERPQSKWGKGTMVTAYEVVVNEDFVEYEYFGNQKVQGDFTKKNDMFVRDPLPEIGRKVETYKSLNDKRHESYRKAEPEPGGLVIYSFGKAGKWTAKAVGSISVTDLNARIKKRYAGTEHPSENFDDTGCIVGADIIREAFQEQQQAKKTLHMDTSTTLDLGGTGSGNFGHAGRKGEVGGSAADGEGGADSGGISQRTTAPEGRDPNPAPVSNTVSAPTPETPLGETRPEPILAKDISDAVSLILKGEVVVLKDVGSVHTVLEKLADIAKDAEAKGEEAPDYDLCKVSVAGSNLFCGDKITNEEFPKGIPRIDMPQMTGKPRPGSEADKLTKSRGGGIDATSAFLEHLKASKIGVTDVRAVAASSLKATQAQLVGATVAGMMTSKDYDPGYEPIFVSNDGYVLDGHHRWAAVVGRDAKDGRLGESQMNVRVVDAPISELLIRANTFADDFGILPKEGSNKAKQTALAMIFDGDVVVPHLPFREKLLKLSERWADGEC